MALHLLISTGLTGDSLIDMVNDPLCNGPVCVPPQMLPFKSTEWLESEGTADTQGVDQLIHHVVQRLENRAVASVCVVFLADLCDQRTPEVLPCLCTRFTGFLDVPAVLRLYAICPSAADQPGLFRERFTQLLENLDQQKERLMEIQWVLTSSTGHDAVSPWHRGHGRAYSMTNLLEPAREVRDGWLVRGVPPQNSSCVFGRSFFDQELWRRYWMNRAVYDLTHRAGVEQSEQKQLQGHVKRYVEENGIIRAVCDARFDLPDAQELNLAESLEDVTADKPVQTACRSFGRQGDRTYKRAINREVRRLGELKANYRAVLADLIGRNPRSLAGLEKALFFHCEMLTCQDDLRYYAGFLKATAGCALALINQLLGFIASFSARTLPEALTGADWNRERVLAHLDKIEAAVDQIEWPDNNKGIGSALLLLVENLRAITQALGNLLEQKTNARKPIRFEATVRALALDKDCLPYLKNVAVDHDKELTDLRVRVKATQEALTKLDESAGYLKRLTSSDFQNKKRSLQEQQDQLETQYEGWQRHVNAYLALLRSYWLLSKHVAYALDVFRRSSACMEEAGAYLLKVERQMAELHQKAEKTLARLPDVSSLDDNMECLLLVKRDMDELYNCVGPVRVADYLAERIAHMPQAPDDRWAELLLLEYLRNLVRYCAQVPPVNLPMLLNREYFSKLVRERMMDLIRAVREHFVPLKPNNMGQRHAQMIWGVPLTDRTDAFFEARREDLDLNWERICISNPDVEIVDNSMLSFDGSPISLDLVINLRGFAKEDYIYWDVAEAGPETK